MEKEVELASIRKDLPGSVLVTGSTPDASNISIQTMIKSVKTLTIPVPSRVESYNLFFLSLEKAFKTKKCS